MPSAWTVPILALHGAMLTEDLDDPEGDLIAKLRRILARPSPSFAVWICTPT